MLPQRNATTEFCQKVCKTLKSGKSLHFRRSGVQLPPA